MAHDIHDHYDVPVSEMPERTPGVALVLDHVRRTGQGAHPSAGQAISGPVMMIALGNGLNPVELQAEVEAYADALDARARRANA